MRNVTALLCFVMGLLLLAAAAAAQEKTTQPIKLRYGVPSEGFVGKQLTPDCRIPWSVRTEALHGGRQEGVQLIHLANGKLRITIVPTRGMGILDVHYDRPGGGPLRLGWDSPVEEMVNPAFINPTLRGGLGWLEGFNEFMCRCGLENIGQPGKDVIVTNTGAKAEVDLTLHGKIANIPARDLELVVDKQPPYRIRVRGRVDEKMLFGPKLELYSEISTEPGSLEFRIEDKVVNKGSQPQEFQVLYHTNFGKPLLSEGARFLAPVKQVTPVNEGSAQDVKRYGDIAGPKSGFVEQVYFLEPLGDSAGKTIALLHDKAAESGVSMRWSLKELPYLTLWRNTGALEDGYVIGIEPGTSYPNTRKREREAGRVPKLAAGASHTMTIDFAIHPSAKELRPVLEQIGALQKAK
jgi:hypothetical protein